MMTVETLEIFKESVEDIRINIKKFMHLYSELLIDMQGNKDPFYNKVIKNNLKTIYNNNINRLQDVVTIIISEKYDTEKEKKEFLSIPEMFLDTLNIYTDKYINIINLNHKYCLDPEYKLEFDFVVPKISILAEIS